ncbi:predicted protein [Sclerotinia sclerotiorum 1980 UF-70]|uniref:Uncharacterized protein n=1 Tax=Sclerotinia sclerotiorum (strain ATCC 18683 / 1980 / Ss-1) TaxID=665079 RepID=A7EXE3_SCLS1|nr:predicted protein [Sclerotinia sclerotiorum 1980 UF-70]EDN94135.1 predicted protein [Sclerotinia sclerotiorum 1980 UF-70]
MSHRGAVAAEPRKCPQVNIARLSESKAACTTSYRYYTTAHIDSTSYSLFCCRCQSIIHAT